MMNIVHDENVTSLIARMDGNSTVAFLNILTTTVADNDLKRYNLLQALFFINEFEKRVSIQVADDNAILSINQRLRPIEKMTQMQLGCLTQVLGIIAKAAINPSKEHVAALGLARRLIKLKTDELLANAEPVPPTFKLKVLQ